jgi:catechol 2,3-dioxygenase-like lactoylglutathione lyase family enzyme
MLLGGFNHVAIMTNDTDRLHDFYRDVFDATIFHDFREGELRLSLVDVGPTAQLNIFELAGNAEADHQTPMFGRGRIDHMGLEAASQEAFDEIRDRLIARNATDGFVTDFGNALSLFFTDPDGLEGEVCLHNPNATPADLKPPGTPAAGYSRTS